MLREEKTNGVREMKKGAKMMEGNCGAYTGRERGAIRNVPVTRNIMKIEIKITTNVSSKSCICTTSIQQHHAHSR